MRNIKGITLISLIVTIIILLILSGITIVMLTGENGLFVKAKQSKVEYKKTEFKEKIVLILSEYNIEKISNEELKLIDFLNIKKEEGLIDDVIDNNNGTIKVTNDVFFIIINKEDLTLTEGIESEEKIEIEISEKDITLSTLNNNNTKKLSATIKSTNPTYTIDWSSDDTSIATVNENGVVTAINGGNTIITAKINGKEIIDTCNVKVINKICEFTQGVINTNSFHESNTKQALDTALNSLTDGQYEKHGTYGALLFTKYPINYLLFTLNTNVNISFSSTYYSDSGGYSGKKAYFYKENNDNYDTLYYTLQQQNNSQKYEKKYFPAGKYKLYTDQLYLEFEQWDFEIVD